MKTRDNLSSLQFALVTYMKSFYTIWSEIQETRMVVHGQLIELAVCLSDLYDVFPLDIVRDTRQNLWTMIYRSQ